MSTPVRVVGFVVALLAVLGISLGAGRVIGPVGPFGATEAAGAGGAAGAAEGHGHGDTPAEAPSGSPSTAGHGAEVPGGLQVSQDGYALRLLSADLPAGSSTPVFFVVEGPDGAPVTAFETQHEKDLHLIAVRRDLSGFQHVHPTLSADGTWSTTLALTPGSWRLFADMAPTGGEPMTLGADVSVGGAYAPVAPPAQDLRVAEVDGYTVNLEGDLTPGADSELTLSVSRAGRPVTDLDPYLGAYGHLVALRAGDLAYLHVHPDGHPGDGTTTPGPGIAFGTSVPSAGTYHLFLDFSHGGVVRTAAFTLSAGSPTAGATEGGDDGHAH